jgi:hypothetical protein
LGANDAQAWDEPLQPHVVYGKLSKARKRASACDASDQSLLGFSPEKRRRGILGEFDAVRGPVRRACFRAVEALAFKVDLAASLSIRPFGTLEANGVW